MPVARKQHTCTYCKQPIHIGHTHARLAEKADGKVRTVRLCLKCTMEYNPPSYFVDVDEQVARAEAAMERRFER